MKCQTELAWLSWSEDLMSPEIRTTRLIFSRPETKSFEKENSPPKKQIKQEKKENRGN